jgi:Uma2 family endonuclease
MSQPALRLPTFDELYREIELLPETMTGEILEPGVLRTMSRPGTRHRRAAQQCFRSLGGCDEASGGRGWWIELEPEIRFGDKLAVPDLAGFRVDRVPELPTDNPLTIVPDWCCEILSPRTARDDRALKLPLYASSGVPWVWLIDPEIRLIEVFEAVQGRATLAMIGKEDESVRLAPFFEEELSLARFWLPHQL